MRERRETGCVRARERERMRGRERENDRLTGSVLLVVVYSCYGYWSMRNKWNNAYTNKKNKHVKSLYVFFSLLSIFLPLTLIRAKTAVTTGLISRYTGAINITFIQFVIMYKFTSVVQ